MKVNITLDVSLRQWSGEFNYTIPSASSELVDHCIDTGVPGSKLTGGGMTAKKAKKG